MTWAFFCYLFVLLFVFGGILMTNMILKAEKRQYKMNKNGGGKKCSK